MLAGTYAGDRSVDSFCSSDVSLDGSTTAADEIGSDTMSLDLSVRHGPHHQIVQQHHHNHNNHQQQQHGHGHGHGHHVGGAAVPGQQINPIDKLYLMQNSYFNNNERWTECYILYILLSLLIIILSSSIRRAFFSPCPSVCLYQNFFSLLYIIIIYIYI